ncbi:MAG TPA: rod shape-determining protein [Candidatus Eremiobacteraceae bacterium]|nr:rod shape-determining protein [Candidatus Eremiobacteraceae bacterium]
MLEQLYASIAPEISIDLGTANTPVHVRGQGIRFVEPTMVAVDTESGAILTVGEGAKQMLGRTPRSIAVIRPMRNGVISNYRYTEALVNQLLQRAMRGRPMLPPRVIVGVPGSATEVEKKAVREAAREAGAGKVYFVAQAMASAVGADLPVTEPRGSMIVDIGGGTTEIAVISLGGIVAARSLKLGGDRFDEAILNYIRATRGFLIGERSAEALKISLGYYGRPAGRAPVKVMGQDLRHLRPGTLEVREEDVGASMAEPLGQIVDVIRSVLEQTPPELVRDLSENGIVLAGGGAAIAGLSETLQLITGIPVRRADRPMLCVALGAAEVLRDRKLFAMLFPAPQSLMGRWWRSLRSGMRESSSYSSR